MQAITNCERCGKEIPVKGGKRKYCTHCSNLVYREKQKISNEKQKLLRHNKKKDEH